jgi:hypothetical protein
MPLLDHFHRPWVRQRPWEGFHSTWATCLSHALNHGGLPPNYVAIPNISLGGGLEIDVATHETNGTPAGPGAVPAPWAPTQPAVTGLIDFAHLDLFEIQIFDEDGGRRLAAAIELVSPGNKDRAAHRQAFITKCASYLQEGVGVLVVDVVTSRAGNLHGQLLQFLQLPVDPVGQSPEDLYAASYRTVGAGEKSRLEAWPEPIRLGEPLPTMPLWLDDETCIPVKLEEAYMAARETLLMV